MEIAYKGYTLIRSEYNNHYMIFEDESGRAVRHAQCQEKLTEETAKEILKNFVEMFRK